MKQSRLAEVLFSKQRSLQAASLYLALFFIAAVTLQLFAFEDFPQLFRDNGVAAPQWVASVVVVLEVAAIPFFLQMMLARTFSIASAVSGAAILLFWLSIGWWQIMSDASHINVGLFGALVELPRGWWLVSFMAALLVLYGYVVDAALSKRKVRNYWLKRRRYGYGWTPVTLNGCLLVAGYIALVVGGTLLLTQADKQHATAAGLSLIVYLLVLTASFIRACYHYAPRPHWRWGKKPSDNPKEDF